MRDKFKKRKLLFIPIFIAAFFLFGAIVMGLWNAILPAVIGVKAISLWQALGILLLSKILFGGFHHGWRGRHGNSRWMEMKEKFSNMTPEEKEKFKSEWKNRCASWKMRGENAGGAGAE